MKIKQFSLVLISLAALAFACTKPEEEVKIISATPTSLNVPAEGGRFAVDVVTTVNWSCTADSWITVTPSEATPTASSSLTSVEVSVSENSSSTAREGSIKFSISGSSATVKVTQAGKTETPDEPETPDNPDEPVTFKGSISSAAEMKAFLDVAADIPEGAEVPIEADIDMTGIEFVSPFAFRGILNGKNHTVKGISSQTSLLLQNYGTVKDLIIEGAYYCAARPEGTFVAGVTNINFGTIQNVTNKASVTVDGSTPIGVSAAGIACESYGTLLNCKNEGAISYSSQEGIYGAPVAGIVGILGGTATGCENKGDVSLSAPFIAGKSAMGQITMKYALTPQVAGIAAYAVMDNSHNVSVTSCNNSGTITLNLTRCDDTPAAPGRVGVAGIVAATGADITSCTNTGAIKLYAVSSTRETVTGSEKNLIVHPAGIAGHEYFAAEPASQNVTNVRNCNNSGDIEVICDISQSNSTAAGIFAWPGVEGAQTKVIEGCVNTGNFTVDGLAKIRVGGINGGTGNVINNKSNCTITVNNTMDTSVFGLLTGFSTQGHRVENNEASGTITSKVKVNGLSGLVGGMGNFAVATGAGNKVNATVSGTDDTVNKGLVIGLFNGKTNNVAFGTYDSPVLVKGTVNGVTVTADNYENYIYGTGNYTPGVHTVIAAFDDGSGTAPGGGGGGGDEPSGPEYTYPVLASFNGRELSSMMIGKDYNVTWPELWVKSDNGSAKLSVNRPEYDGKARSAPKKSQYTFDTDPASTWFEKNYYVCQGFIKGDYWLFEIPVKDLPAGTVAFSGSGACSTASVKFWLMEFSVDGQKTWTPVEPKTTSTTASGTSIGRDVTYSVEYPKAGKDAENNVRTPINLSFDNPAVSGESVLYVRLMACDLLRGDETEDVTNAENGGGSRLGDIITFTHTAK